MSVDDIRRRTRATFIAQGKSLRYGDDAAATYAPPRVKFHSRPVVIEAIAGGPTLSKTMDKSKCPRCGTNKVMAVKLDKNSGKLPYCTKCRVVIPEV